FGDEGARVFGIAAVGGDDVAATLGDGQRGGPADAAAGAGDEGDVGHDRLHCWRAYRFGAEGMRGLPKPRRSLPDPAVCRFGGRHRARLAPWTPCSIASAATPICRHPAAWKPPSPG